MNGNEHERPRTCPSCNAIVAPNARQCPKCRQPLALSSGGVSEKLPNCPVCKIPIYPAEMAGFEILHCAECEGTAYKRGTIMKLQPQEPKSIKIGEMERSHVTPPYFEKREKPPFLICPFCGKKMTGKKMGQMTVDLCEKCGAIFLERGKEKHINEIIGPYKMQMLNKGGGGSSFSRRRRR